MRWKVPQRQEGEYLLHTAGNLTGQVREAPITMKSLKIPQSTILSLLKWLFEKLQGLQEVSRGHFQHICAVFVAALFQSTKLSEVMPM